MLVGFGMSHNVLVMSGATKEGVRRQVRFWAERGLIHCEDSLDASYSSMTVRQFLRRAKALAEMLGNSDPSKDVGADANLREEVLGWTEQAGRIARIAQEQGMPSDASARRDLVRRRPRTVAFTDPRAIL